MSIVKITLVNKEMRILPIATQFKFVDTFAHTFSMSTCRVPCVETNSKEPAVLQILKNHVWT